MSAIPLTLKRRDKEAEKKREAQAKLEREQAEAPPKTEAEIATEEFLKKQNIVQDEDEKKEEEAAALKVNTLHKSQIEMNEERCLNCRKASTLVIKQHEGTLVCRDCGEVHSMSMIDQTLEKRNFSSELSGSDGNNNRVNARGNQFLPSLGLNTIITGNNANAKELNKQNYPKMSSFEKNITEGQRRIK